MTERRALWIASLLTVLTGTLWGIYWIPVRQLAETMLPGAWGSLVITAVATLLLTPFAIIHRQRLRAAGPLSLAAIALGGAAFLMYSVGLVYGRIAIVILLFYLTPVWSTLIARFGLGWPMPRLRYLVIVIGLSGLLLVLGADGIPIPRSAGDWLGLASGALWAVSSTGIRTSSNNLAPAESTFVFVLGALIAAAILAPLMAPWPGLPADSIELESIAWIVAAAGLWWGASMAALLWAASRLEPARLGILLMSEVLVGILSSALLAGEPLGLMEACGGALVIAAAVLELWPAGTTATAETTRGEAS